MSWIIRPLLQVDENGKGDRWAMTALWSGTPVTGIRDGVTIREVGELLANPDHTHDNQFGCKHCSECQAWAEEVTTYDGSKQNSAGNPFDGK